MTNLKNREDMPIKTTLYEFTKSVSFDTITCITSYIITGAVMNSLLDTAISYIGSLLTLASIAIFVFYIKKWLEKKDKEINENGGFFSFIKALISQEYRDKCTDKKEINDK